MSRSSEDRNRRLLRARDTIERFYGTDCALRDPFGNPLRFTEHPRST
jgi:hypothetical protein